MKVSSKGFMDEIVFFHTPVDYLWTNVIAREIKRWYEDMRQKKELNEGIGSFALFRRGSLVGFKF